MFILGSIQRGTVGCTDHRQSYPPPPSGPSLAVIWMWRRSNPGGPRESAELLLLVQVNIVRRSGAAHRQ